MQSDDFNLIEKYLDFYGEAEPPTIFNRWCCIGGIGALIGKNAWIQHGHKKIYPNQYIMLVGESGSRKSTAIKVFQKPLLEQVGFKAIAANKTSKEKFLMDFEKGMDKVNDIEEELDVTVPSKGNKANPTLRNLFGIKDTSEVSECLIMSDDFNIFIGHGNIEFIELLTDLWDYEGLYSSRIKSGKSVLVPNPILNMLIGDTQVGISMAFPTEVIGQGIFSRMIQVFAEPRTDADGKPYRVTFPPPADLTKQKELLDGMDWIKKNFRGPVEIHPMAYVAFDDIYKNWKDLDDVRFKSYSTRRFTHLLKLSMCCAAARKQTRIDTRIVEYANSILHYTESFMPKALGEFGKARNSDVASKIIEICEAKLDQGGAELMKDIWPQVHRDLESTNELAKVVYGMVEAGKLQKAQNSGKFLPSKKIQNFNDFPHCKPLLLREYVEQKKKEGTL